MLTEFIILFEINYLDDMYVRNINFFIFVFSSYYTDAMMQTRFT